MRKFSLILVALTIVVLTVPMVAAASLPASSNRKNRGFVHGIVIPVDGVDYYLAGAPDGPDGAFDVPGHDWVRVGRSFLVGKHYNTGPFGAPSWWSSDAGDGSLLFIVLARIDTWSPEKADWYSSRGYVHYHELITVSDGTLHPTKVVWLKHFAVGFFNFDGGPHPELAHYVTPGVDYDFIPNYMMPYNP
jgi:selenium-binding protein 1